MAIAFARCDTRRRLDLETLVTWALRDQQADRVQSGLFDIEAAANDHGWEPQSVSGDGVAELSVTDDGTGTWALGADRAGGLRWFGLDGLERLGTDVADLDGDGAAERLADADGDGLADRAFGAGSAWVDTDGDGRWDLRLGDTDGDGRADTVGSP